MSQTTSPSQRTQDQLHEQYLVEKELAERLKRATKTQRRALYPECYDELYSRVPHHPGHTRQSNARETAEHVRQQLALFEDLLRGDEHFLEIGAGDCHLALEVARRVRQVTALEVSGGKLADSNAFPDNFRLLIGDGIDIDLPPESVDFAYSYQVMEHLHEEDAEDQLRAVYNVLSPGGYYLCATPHRFMGPSDVSRYFAHEPEGMHLKEYTQGELQRLFARIGFRRVRARVSLKWTHLWTPVLPIAAMERALNLVPCNLRRPLTSALPLRLLLTICILGQKPA